MDTEDKPPYFHPEYNHPDGDVVLSTNDGVLFRVHSFILKVASGFFRQMLEVPRAATEYRDDPIPLDEDAQTIVTVLNIIYPHEDIPAIKTYKEAWALATAADKYDMPRVLKTVRSAVTTNEDLRIHKVRLYALACHWKWEDVIEAAALGAVDYLRAVVAGNSFEDGVDRLGAKELLRLFRFHQMRVDHIIQCISFTEDFNHPHLRMDPEDPEAVKMEYWVCNCGTTSLTVADAIRSLQTLQDGVRGYLGEHPRGDYLTEEWFAKGRGRRLWMHVCGNCTETFPNVDDMRSRIDMALRFLPFKIPWSKCN
ncbi:hypothetical protein DFH11DRAFT_573923 [Phellopilus nigrolimitatus]|nr:hypothetical protein DFH11DRAFT_573923 [Phellopilus nigrolimitatus]